MNKRQVIKSYKDNFKCFFEIEEYNHDDANMGLQIRTDLPLDADFVIPKGKGFSGIKNRIYKGLWAIAVYESFSWSVEARSVNDIEEMVLINTRHLNEKTKVGLSDKSKQDVDGLIALREEIIARCT